MARRKNSRITDLKYNTKRRLQSLKGKAVEIGSAWHEVDFFIAQRIEEELLNRIDDILKDVDGVDPKSH